MRREQKQIGNSRVLGFIGQRVQECGRAAVLRVATILLALLVAPSAVGQEDGAITSKPSLMWLSADTNVPLFDNSNYNSFIGVNEFWSQNWGVSANLLKNDGDDIFGLPQDSEYFNLDVKRRFGGRDKSNFELGLGWQELSIESQLEASGPKVSLAGRLNIASSLQLYGSTSYFPELEDTLQSEAASGYEFEAGVLYKPLPSVSLKAGYRQFSLDIEDSLVEDLGSSSRFLLGTDWSW